MNIKELTEQYLQITNIEKITDDDIITHIIIALSNNTAINISVDIDTDELIFSINQFITSTKKSIPILQHIKEKTLIRSWVMYNHMGYQDAIQFEFFDKQNGTSHFVQLMVISSEIFVYEFNQV